MYLQQLPLPQMFFQESSIAPKKIKADSVQGKAKL